MWHTADMHKKKGGIEDMKMVFRKTVSGKDFYLPLDDNYDVIEPIFIYLKQLAIKGCSKNTLRQNCLNLLAFWEYLTDRGFDYIEFVGKKSSTCKGAYENLTDYKLYLLYPTLREKVTPISGVPQARKESTVNQMLSSVISFYKFLSDADLVGELPVIRQMGNQQHTNSMLNQMFMKRKKAYECLLSSKVQKDDLRYVSAEEFKKCWDNCTSRRNRIIIGLMYYGGLRVSEVVGLNLTDLRDIAQNTVYIKLRKDPDNEDAAVKYNSQGGVTIVDMLRDEIINYMNEDLDGIDTNYLIINFNGRNAGGAMRTDTIRDMIDALGRKIGIPGLHPHAFRHGCAMRMLRAGAQMVEISTMLRHRHVQTTADIYAKYDLSDKIRVQDKVSKKMNERFSPLDIDFEKMLEKLFEGEEDDEDE